MSFLTTYHVVLEFTEPLLGTVPKSEDIYAQYIAGKAPDDVDVDLEGELETVPEGDEEEKGWTGFHTDEAGPHLLSYVVKGFFKDACSMLRRADGTKSSKLRAYKKKIDGLVFPQPRRIYLQLPEGESLGVLERPLRASTPQGERVSLVRSDTAPAGTRIEFTLEVLDGDVDEAILEEWFEYGRLRGFGQWRNAGFGRVKIITFERGD